MINHSQNPYLPSWEYVPDGEPHVFGNRVYLFGSHDKFNGKAYCENDYVVWSADVNDLSVWTNHGIVYRKEQDPFCKGKNLQLWAPDVTRGVDGRYYLYYATNFVNRIAVAVADRPEGPYNYYGEVHYSDGTRYGGKPKELIRFDPAVLTDDDGRVWLYTGIAGINLFFKCTAFFGNCTIDGTGSQVVQLANDMLTVISEPKYLLPGKRNAMGTGFEGHEFFEASSIRKFDGKYYAIYSSFLSHELAWAVSDHPDRGFTYGGTLHSNANILSDGDVPTFYWGNNHGSVEKIGDRYFVFGHRQTNRNECSRQGVAEPIRFESGRFYPAECTSQGLCGAPLSADTTYEASICCVLYARNGARKIVKMRPSDPYITQTGADRENDPCQYIANIRSETTIGYKYFDFTDAKSLHLTCEATGEGKILVSTDPNGVPIGEGKICKGQTTCDIALGSVEGVKPLYLRYLGTKKIDLFTITLLR